MRILVDQDAVIASWGLEYDRCLDALGEPAAGIPRTADQEDWNLKNGRSPEEQEIIERIMCSPGFYARLEPIPGAKTALNALLKQGNDVRIVTAPYISNPTCASDKLNWVVKHYGSHWGARVIMTNDKTAIRGDVLIDDRPRITGFHDPEWKHIVFGDYAYNRDAAGLRLKSWDMTVLAPVLLHAAAFKKETKQK